MKYSIIVSAEPFLLGVVADASLRSGRNWFNGPERIFQSRLCGLRL
jgi:hypothetical protein